MSDSQPEQLSKAETVTVLKGAIARLEKLVTRLEGMDTETLLASETEFTDLSQKIDQLATVLDEQQVTPPIETSPEPVPEASGSEETAPEVSDTPEPSEPVPEPSSPESEPKPAFLASLAETLLNRVRGILPTAWSEKLSNGVLSGIIAAVLGVLVITPLLFSGGEPPQEVAETPPTPVEQPSASPSPTPEKKAPEPPNPELPKGKPKAPKPPKPVQLTPEQNLIAAIQEQVSEITNEYAEGLIRSIQANFADGRLVVTVGEEWYNLPEQQQNQLADEVLARSQTLDFRKIAMLDDEGTTIARSPVVGQQMVILRREPLKN